MSKRTVPHPTPVAWAGAIEDRAYHLDTGAGMVINGQQLMIEGFTVPPLHQWFDRTRSAPADKVARLVCGRCGSPAAALWRVWQPGSETVAMIEYQLPRREDRRDEVTIHRALLHLPAEGCAHGRILMHPDESLSVFCRRHEMKLSGERITELVRAHGGWGDTGPEEPPTPKRVALR